jgi:hypothetical protein
MLFRDRASKRARLRRVSVFITCAVAVVYLGLVLETHDPKEIVARPVSLPGNLAAQCAPGLVIQQVDETTIWSVRGYRVYKSADGTRFTRAFKVPSGSLASWLGNLPLLRRMFGYQELCEILPLRSGTILAFAGGYLWRSTDGGHAFHRVEKVGVFGIGRGRGIMPKAFAEDREGIIYYGEYYENPRHEPVCIHRSLDDGKAWQVIYQFGAGDIRHVHSLSVDPYTNALWVTTGDRDQECIIAYSVDKGVTFHTVGTGSQQWRAVDIIFTRDSVYWGTDAPSIQNWICRLDRQTLAVEKICKVDGPIYYSTSLCDGMLVVGSAVEGGKGEWDGVASIWLSRDGKQWTCVPLAKRRSPRRQAVLRFPRGRCWPFLLVTPLNTESCSGELLKLDIKASSFP